MELHIIENVATRSDAERCTDSQEIPRLNYSLRERKWRIILFWSFILLDSLIMPIGLYFSLWYLVGPGAPGNQILNASQVFGILTATLCGTSILEYVIRLYDLCKRHSSCRVVGASRWALDWFHWIFSIALIIVVIELVAATVPNDPNIRLVSMPLATTLFIFGSVSLVLDMANLLHITAPFNISSTSAGVRICPGIYPLIEDICAVDGKGGTAFRVALARRYKASSIFRATVRRVGFFWSCGAEACAILCLVLIIGIESAELAYVLGWSVPFCWAGIWTCATFWYVKRELKKEEELWYEGRDYGRV